MRDEAKRRFADAARPEGVDALGVDETTFLTANAQHPTVFITGIGRRAHVARASEALDPLTCCTAFSSPAGPPVRRPR